jgi:multiple sugar transport system substrate-binding protein
MSGFSRRDLFKIGAGAAAGGALGLPEARAQASEWKIAPEKGAKLRVMRPSKFVDGDEKLFVENTKKYQQQSGVEVRIDFESWEDLVPKTAVSASVGKGADVIYGWYDLGHQFPDKLVPLTDVANYLGGKYEGWYPLAQKYSKRGNTWIQIPLGASGAKMNYRKSMIKEAGFDSFPNDFPGFLKLCQGLKAKSKPPGFALGHAVGDANGWTHWVLWGHGAKIVDDKDNVVLNSPETIAALEYAKQCYETFIPGTLTWLDPSNNKAFLDGQISLTANGISIYYVAKNSTDPALKAIAEDMDHAQFPIGPVGKATENCTMVSAMLFKYCKYPNAAKDYIRFMMEKEQMDPFLEAAIGYWGHPLKYYEKNKIWNSDPKILAFKDVVNKALWLSYSGAPGAASAGVFADYVVVDMFAQAATGQKSAKDAAAEAQKRAERYYKL